MRRSLVFLFLCAAVAVCPAANGQKVDWFLLDPSAVRVGSTAGATFRASISGPVSAARLDLAGGGSVDLTHNGTGEWSAPLSAAQLLAGYTAADVNRKFLGYLRLIGSTGTVLATYNEFVEVVDSSVPPVTPRPLDSSARATQRVVNLLRPHIEPSTASLSAAAIEFYKYYPDVFDFLFVVFALPSTNQNRSFTLVRNNIVGIGVPMRDAGGLFGSAAKLQGVIYFPISSLYDAAEPGALHELGHRWVQFLPGQPFVSAAPHWPQSTMARGIMGANIAGSTVGGMYPWAIERQGDGTYVWRTASAGTDFNDLDLYLMGFRAPEAVAPQLVLNDQSAQPCHGCIITAGVRSYTVNDLVTAAGPRIPAAAAAPKAFRIGTVVITRDRLLNDDEMALLEYFAARGEARAELPYSSGFLHGTARPFFVATSGAGRLDLRLETASPRRRAVRKP